MRTLILFFFGSLLSIGAYAQPSAGYDDLKILFADGSYEKLVRQCEKYINKDATKKDPTPYLWMTKALYGIDVSGSDNENFKNAFKDGINYLGKCFKYDTEEAVQDEHAEFIDEYTLACIERIVNEIESGAYRKAYSWNIKYKKIARDDVGRLFMEGALKFRNSDKGGANTSWKLANIALEKVTSIEDFSKADKSLLMYGAIQSAEAMISGRQLAKAQDLLNKVAPWFEDNDEFQEEYDKVVN